MGKVELIGCGCTSRHVAMSELGQTEKNSVRAYAFRFAFELGHCSIRSTRLKRANRRHRRLSLI
jgi:hypothetical protein